MKVNWPNLIDYLLNSIYLLISQPKGMKSSHDKNYIEVPLYLVELDLLTYYLMPLLLNNVLHYS